MEISSAKPKTVYVPLSATFDINDKLPAYIIQKLKALGIQITKNMTEADALALIAEKEEKIKEKEKLEKIRQKKSKENFIEEQKLLNSLEMISLNNKIALKLSKKEFD